MASRTLNKRLDVLLYGPGAVGAYYAFILQRSSRVRLFVIARSAYDAIKSNGITIKSDFHGEHVFRPAGVYRSPSEAGRVFDYIVCANKAIEPEKTIQDLVPVVDVQTTTLALMQNGVGIEEPFRRAFPTCPIISGVIWVAGTQIAPGIVHHHASESTDIGVFEGKDIDPVKQQQSLDQFVSFFRETETPIHVSSNIQTARWRKTIWNMAWNSLTTLTSLDTASWLLSSNRADPVTRALMAEGIRVAIASGVSGLTYELIDEFLIKINEIGPIYSSMYHDSKAGRPMEVEVIFGNIVRMGQTLSVPTPKLDLVYSLLLAIDGRTIKQSC